MYNINYMNDSTVKNNNDAITVTAIHKSFTLTLASSRYLVCNY